MDVMYTELNIITLKMDASSQKVTGYFTIFTILNIVFIFNRVDRKLAQITCKKGRNSLQSYVFFIACLMGQLALNLAVFFLLTPPNLYEELGISRSMTGEEIKTYSKDIKIKIMAMEQLPMRQRVHNIQKAQEMINVFVMPARRLSYDTFGQTGTEYAWAFQDNNFLLEVSRNSFLAYVVYAVIILITDKRGEIKQTFKYEIMVLILLFLCEFEVIMNTEMRYNTPSDFLDLVFPAFPIFERREMMKFLFVSIMFETKIFFKYFVGTEADKKFMKLAKNPQLRQFTNAVRQSVAKKMVIDQHLEDRVEVALNESKNTQPLKTDLYALQRKCLQSILYLDEGYILPSEEATLQIRYFLIK